MTVIGNCFKICRWWFDWLFTKKMLEFSFLKVLVIRYNSISRKSVYFSPALTVILNLANNFLGDFDVVSALLGVLLCITANPSSLKIPNSPFLNNFVVII